MLAVIGVLTCWRASVLCCSIVACRLADERAMLCYNMLACSPAVACWRAVSAVAGVLACRLQRVGCRNKQ